MKIYTYPKSRSLRVLWALEEMGSEYEPILVDLLSPNPTVISPHPCGKVPFLTDEKVSVSETLAICIYLCEQHPDTCLYPTDPREKASVNSWLSFALTDLEAPVWILLKQMVFIPEGQRSPDLMSYFTHEASNVISRINLNPTHSWIAGSSFTLADIFLSHTLHWAKLCGIEMHKEIDGYITRAMSRPAFMRAQEKNNQ
ncbi:glutathione S-transferase family protein [Atlantibacter hermannii]|uniref:glutathione S-transferase family protein n=1 Tax=Atlantibacter hermannii TaxID=565 RepID=UPI0028AC2D18|nr:glutathione S-transferase family protein [Atlantibacter hermannii]